MNYLIPYPYTVTIMSLLTFTVICVAIYRDRINWEKYLHGLLFTGVFGVAQIHGLENLGNTPAWYFPDGSSLWGAAFKHVYWDDILFVPACYSVFYFFMYWMRGVKDIVPKKYYIHIIAIAIILEAMLYQVGGEGTRILMVAYTLIPLLLFIFYVMIKKIQINVTHALLTLLFVIVFSSVWEIFNAWRQHWVYDTSCDLFGEFGWFYGSKLHVGIFFQYAWSGFIVMYSTVTIYGGANGNHSRK